MKKQQRSTLSRRSFLKALGVTAGMLSTSVLPTYAESKPLRNNMARLRPDHSLKIGVLIPGSTMHASLGDNLIAGMRLYFDQAQARDQVQLIKEHIGIGVSGARQKSSKLIREDDVDLVVGVVSPAIASWLHDIYDESHTLLLATDGGANLVRPSEQSPHIFHNSFGYWQANWAMGNWAPEHLGKKGLIASSLYESGYDTLNAFRTGFERAGGEIVGTYVTHVQSKGDELASLMTAIKAVQPDFVYALYSGPAAIDFVRAYAASGLEQQIRLASSGFTVDENILPALGAAALGITSCRAWSPSLPSIENQAFVSAYRQATGRLPDAFAVLGYDTARLLSESLAAVGGDITQTGKLRNTLREAQFISPRGLLKMNSQTHTVSTPLYLTEVRQHGATPRNEVIAEWEMISEWDRRIASLHTAVKSGWINAYLSV